MRYAWLAVGLVIGFSSLTVAQDVAIAPPAAETPLVMYRLQISEVHCSTAVELPPPPANVTEELAKLHKDGRIESIERVQMTALAGLQSTAQFGRTVAVTVGSTQLPQGRFRSMQQVNVGTLVRVTTAPRDGKILVELQYEASRLSGEGTENGPPPTDTTQFNTTLLVEPSEPVLVGGITQEKTSFLVLSIAE